MTHYHSTMWETMEAVKFQLKQYRSDDNCLVLASKKNEVNWGLGFVLPQVVYPVVTVFPVEQVFGPRRGGGISIVERRMAIDLYSAKYDSIDRAKEWVLKAAEDVQKCVKGAITLQNGDGKKVSFKTAILSVNVSEQPDSSGTSFRATGTVQIAAYGYHQMSRDRIQYKVMKTTDELDFIERVEKDVRKAYHGKHVIKRWTSKVGKSILKRDCPAVQILPGSLFVDDEIIVGNRDKVERNILFHVMTNEYPRVSVIKNAVETADDLVTAIEDTYMVGGYANNAVPTGIVYEHAISPEFEFHAVVGVDYDCWQTYDRIIN